MIHRAGTDRVLLERTAKGDRDAWLDLWERHAVLLFAYLSGILGNAREAQHLMDETFLRAWCEAGRFDPSGNIDPPSWLLGLARQVLSGVLPRSLDYGLGSPARAIEVPRCTI